MRLHALHKQATSFGMRDHASELTSPPSRRLTDVVHGAVDFARRLQTTYGRKSIHKETVRMLICLEVYSLEQQAHMTPREGRGQQTHTMLSEDATKERRG